MIRTGRHASSIDERRCYFRDNLWGKPHAGQDIKRVWFAGVHSDMGGSYPEAESGLSKVTLEWMLVEAGLRVNPHRANVVLGRQSARAVDAIEPNATAAMHESLHGAWWILELLPHGYVDKSSGARLVRWRIPGGQLLQFQMN
ncbi:MAG: phospholipase effector Tle1 domain-containing protein [Bryobacteraceae bacterium]